MFQITITIHSKSRRFGTLGEIIETTVETTDDERIRQLAFGGNMRAIFASREHNLGAEAGSSSGGGRQLYTFERGAVVIEIGPDVAEPAADAAELEAERAEIAALSAERDAELQAEQAAAAGAEPIEFTEAMIAEAVADIDAHNAAVAEREQQRAGVMLVPAGELEQTKQPRTVRQVRAVGEQLQRKLERAVERAGASSLYRIEVSAGDPDRGNFSIDLVRRADDARIAHAAAGHDVAAWELYRIGGEVFRAGISREIEQILAESQAGARA